MTGVHRFMRQVFVSQNLIEVESFEDILTQDGIPCTIKNKRGTSLAGEVPFAEVFPELWVINDEDFSKAKELLDDWVKAGTSGGSTWQCQSCGEQHSSEFTSCWKCGKDQELV